MAKVSVVIPCFNQGRYLDETVNSVLAQSYADFEIIVVNDGSTDEFTNSLLRDYLRPKTRVIHTENQGVCLARNSGIEAASGEYILPLDADDLIGRDYFRKAVQILDEIRKVGIVSCQLEFFGELNYRPAMPPYSLDVMLTRNELGPCSSFFRREDWQRVGGYNPNMKHGWEDWDFWLSLIELGVDVYRIPEVLFFYRIRKGSRERSMTRDHHLHMYMQLYCNHKELYESNMAAVFREVCDYHELLGSRSYKYATFLENPGLMVKRIVDKLCTLAKIGPTQK